MTESRGRMTDRALFRHPSSVIRPLSSAALALALAATPALAAKGRAMSDEQVAGLFASTCGFCHQEGGRVAGKGPQLMGDKNPDAFLVARIKQGKEGAMPAFGRQFSDAQIKSIVHYIRSLKPE
jgi:mono/diheme cytochrome c family protein